MVAMVLLFLSVKVELSFEFRAFQAIDLPKIEDERLRCFCNLRYSDCLLFFLLGYSLALIEPELLQIYVQLNS